MRVLNFLFLLLFLSDKVSLFSQTNLTRNYIVAQTSLGVGISAAEMDAQGNLYVFHDDRSDGGYFWNPVIHRLKPNGDVDLYYNQYEAPHFFRLVPVSDGVLWLTAGGYCDLFYPPVLSKLDTNGIALWQLPFSELGIEFTDQPAAGLMPVADGSLWIFFPDRFPVHISAQGEVIGIHDVVEPIFDQSRVLSDSASLTWGNHGVSIYHKDLIWGKSALGNIHVTDVAVLDNGHIVAMSEGGIWLLDANLNLLKTLPWSSISGLSTPKGIETTGTEVLILGNSDTMQVLCSLNEQLEAPGIVPLHDATAFSGEYFSYFDGQLVITGLNGSNTLACTQHPLNTPQYAGTQDVAVTGVEAPDIYVTLNSQGLGYLAMWNDINVTISNAGADTLQKVTISSLLNQFTYICPLYSDFSRTWDALNLPPGQSTTLHIPLIEWGTANFFQSNIQICFTATVPNDSLDAVPANNRFCKNFQQIVPTEEEERLSALQLSPNPARSVARLTLPATTPFPAQVTINNAFGQVVQEQNLSESMAEWPVHTWPAGYYVVHIRDNRGKQTSVPLIVQH